MNCNEHYTRHIAPAASHSQPTTQHRLSLVVLILLTVLQDPRELDVVQEPSLDWRISEHVVNLHRQALSRYNQLILMSAKVCHRRVF